MIRDIVLVMQNRKDIDDVALWLGIAFIIMIVASAILPIDVLVDHMQNTTKLTWGFLYMPDVHGVADPLPRLLLQILSTFIVAGLIIPMIRDFKGQPVNMFALLIVTVLISAPFALVSYLWLPQYWYALLSAFAVLFFILMLLLTRGGNQHKKIRPPIKKPSTRPPKPEEKTDAENKPE
jgi:asparagine N-glycosylation enzyme membrane subunit Stt3